MSKQSQIEQELEASEPWRRAKQFIAKPYGVRDREEAKRFLKNFLSASEGVEMPGNEWTYRDVYDGNHEGGTNNPIAPGGGAAVQARKLRQANVRFSKAMAMLKEHMLVHAIKDKFSDDYVNDPEGALAWFLAEECGGPTSEPAVNEIKAEMQAATIIGAVGYKLGSVSSFALFLQQLNGKITNAAERMSEHDVAVLVLDKLGKSQQQAVSTDALKEYDADAAARTCLQPNAGRGNAGDPPAGARSVDRVIRVFGKQWDSLINAKIIHERPKGGRQSSSGNSTRVDGMQLELDGDSGAMDPVMSVEESEMVISALDTFLEHNPSPDELRATIESVLSAEPKGAMAREKICFRCFGLGHTENEDKRAGTKGCSSQKRNPPRDINAFLLLITALAARRKDRQGQSRIPIENQSSPSEAPRRPRSRPAGRAAPGRRPAWWRSNADAAEDEEAAREEAEAETCVEVEAEAATPEADKKQPKKQPKQPKTAAPPASADPFGSSLEDDADWVDPYDAEEIIETEEPYPSGLGKLLMFPLRMLKQWLVLLLWLWTSPAMAIINALPGSNAIAMPASFPTTRIYRTDTARMQPFSLVQMAEDAMWQARGYEVQLASEVTTEMMKAGGMTVDSGATGHCTGFEGDVTDLHPVLMPKIKIRVASGSLSQVTKMGNSAQVVKVRQSTFKEVMNLKKMRFSEGLSTRLFSVREGYEADGIKSHFNGVNSLVLPGPRKHEVKFEEHQRKYMISAAPLPSRKLMLPRVTDDKYQAAVKAQLSDASYTELALAAMDEHQKSMMRHAQLGHFSHNRIGGGGMRLHRNCHACMLGGSTLKAKQHGAREDNRKRGEEYSKFGQRVSSDLVTGLPPSVRHGFVAAIIFYDWATSHIGVAFLKTKDHESILAAFKQYEADNADLLRPVGGSVVEWHRDGELTSDVIENHLANKGDVTKDAGEMASRLATKSTLSVPYDKNTNPGAERAIGIILRPMRIMAACHEGEGNPYSLWPFLMQQAVHIHNDLPTRRFGYKQTPNEGVGRESKLDKYHVMLGRCYVHIPKSEREIDSKLYATAHVASYLGYDVKRDSHFVYIKSLNRITSSRDITFPDNEMQFEPLPSAWSAHFYFPQDKLEAVGDEFQQRLPLQQPARRVTLPVTNAVPGAAPLAPIAAAVPMPAAGGQGADRVLFPADGADLLFTYRETPFHPVHAFTAKTTAGPIPLPKNEMEALDENNPYHKEWRAAMLLDCKKKEDNGATCYADTEETKAKGYRIHGGKWAFAIKYEDDGITPKEFRARWVFKGFTEIEGVDYDDTFIGTIVGATQRIMIAEAARRCKVLYECDVRAAFTTATMDRELYFQCPRPFSPKGKCCKAVKSMEGSKQAGNLYYKEHSTCFTEKLKLERCKADPNLYRKITPNGYIYIGVLVDNCLILPSDHKMLNWFLTEYKKHYTITGGDPVKKFNGVQVEQDTVNGKISIYQPTYIEQVYRKFLNGMTRTMTAPVEPGEAGAKKFMALEGAPKDKPDPLMHDKDYPALIGCLNYISQQSRPDVTFHVSFLSQFMSNPSIKEYDAALNVLCYLYHTRQLKITYGGKIRDLPCQTKPEVSLSSLEANNGLHVGSDASFGSIKSHGGHVVMYMNAAICWVSRRLKVVAVSSTEAEVAAGVPAAKDIRFVLHILDFFGVEIKGAVPLLIDNEGMWFNVRNEGVSARTRYWELWMHFVREMYMKGMLAPFKVDSEDEFADLMTKAMTKGANDYVKFRNYIMNKFF